MTPDSPLKVSVLYLEDMPTISKLVSRMLSPKVETLYQGENGKEGWELFLTHRPDIVISDIMMPEMSGLDLAKKIRAESPETQIILTTAFNYSQYLFAAINTGVNRYLLKPVREEQLFQALESCARNLEFLRASRKQPASQSPDLQNLFNALNDFVLVVDQEGKLAYWNAAVEKKLGYTPKELLGLHSLELHAPEDREEAASLLFDLLSGEKTLSMVPFVSRQGKKIPVETRVSRGLWQDQSCLFAVSRDITEQKKAEEEIHRLIEELKDSNRQLERFAYVASHDLREPLRMIHSYLSLIQARRGTELSEEGSEYLHFVLDASRRMENMVQRLLRYARLNGKEVLKTVSLNQVLENAKNNLRLKIEEKKAEMICDTLPSVSGDAGQLERLFQNLLENALKYNPSPKPLIEIQCRRRETEYEISVKDNGRGIEKAYHDRLFQIFTRLPGSDRESSGIGLAECRKIVENHGGKIWLKTGESPGACFYFTLPVL